MAVIKSASAKQLVQDAVVLDLADIARQGEMLKRAAREQAERIVSDARAEREKIISGSDALGHAEGLERGLAEGRATGEAEGKAEAISQHEHTLRELEAAWAASLEEFVAQRDHLVMACKRDVLRIAISIAERITHRTIRCDEHVVCDQIEAALRLVAKPTRAIVAVHPENLRAARDSFPALTARIDGIEHADLVEDESLSPGSCVVRTAEGGVVNADVERQLERIADMLVPGLSAELTRAAGDAASDADAADDAEQGTTDEQRGDLAA